MRFSITAAFVATLCAPAFCTDLMVTKTKHTDASKMMGMDQPAKDATETSWIGKDRMRTDDGESITIIRLDQKKMYMLDPKAKTVQTIDLPFELKKYVPADMAPMLDMMGQMKVTVTPTTETKKIKDWNATKYTMTMATPMGGGFTQEIWATKDIQFDQVAFNELHNAIASLMSLGMGGSSIATEYKKIEGFPVLTERTQTMMGQSIKSREEVTAVESKDAPEGAYDVPKDYTEKPFDPMSMNPMGGGGPRGRGGKPGGPPPTPDKPKDQPLMSKQE